MKQNNKKSIISKYNKNSLNNKNKHRRFLSTSESYTSNFLNNIYSSNISHINHSNIIGSNINSSTGNTNNMLLNYLSYKNKQRNS